MKLHVREKGSPYYPENRVKNPKERVLKAIYRAIDLLKEGVPRSTVEGILIEEKYSTKFTKEEAMTMACKVIDDVYRQDHKATLGLHLTRYNKDIDDLFFMAENDYADAEFIKQKIQTYLCAMDIMYAKEKLVQLHKHVRVTKLVQKNKITEKTQRPKENFDLSNLSNSERIELLDLIEKTLVTEDEEMSVQITSSTETITEEGFTEVEVIEEANVSKIKQITKEIKKEKTNTAIIDIKEKLRQQLEEVARRKFKEVGSKDGVVVKDYTENN